MPECIMCNTNVIRRTRFNLCYMCLEDLCNKSSGDLIIRCSVCGSNLLITNIFSIGIPLSYITIVHKIIIYSCDQCKGTNEEKEIFDKIALLGYYSKIRCKKCDLYTLNPYPTQKGYCEYCTLKNRTCDNCKNIATKTISSEKSLQGISIHYCEECAKSLMFCSKCEKAMFTSQWLKCTDYFRFLRTGKLRCNNCDYSASDRLILEYNYKPIPIFKPKKITNNLYLGIELELEFNTPKIRSLESMREIITLELDKTFPNLLSDVYYKYDGSLNYGYEIVTHPMILDYHKNKMNWHDILQFLKDKKIKSHDTTTCGLHIHVNKNFFNQSDQIKLNLFFNSQANKISIISRRINNHYSIFSALPKGKIKFIDKSQGHYAAINWNNRSTIEFRTFKGTLNYYTFMSTLEFVDAMCRFIKKSSLSLTKKRNSNWNSFIDFLDENYEEYTFLPKYLEKKKLFKVDSTKGENIYDSSSDGLPLIFDNSKGYVVVISPTGNKDWIDDTEKDEEVV